MLFDRVSAPRFPEVFSVVMILLPIVFVNIFCGSSIKKAQDFKPNKAPVVSAFTVTYIGNDSTYDSGNLYAGMPFLVMVNAVDPEGKDLSYSVISDQGTFGSQKATDTGVLCRFYTGSVDEGAPVTITLTVTDPKNASFSQTIDVGSGKTGPGISVVPPSRQVISASDDIELSVSCDCKGVFKIYKDNSISSVSDAVLGTTGLLDYSSAGTGVSVDLLGPSSGKSGGIALDNNVKNLIWIVFRDSNSEIAKSSCALYVEGNAPVVISCFPSNGAENISVSPQISVQFSKAIDSSTLTADSFVVKDSAGTAVSGSVSYDSSSSAVIFSPSGALSYDSTYSVKLSTGVADSVGNTMSSSFEFSFVTAAKDSLPAVELSPAPGTYKGVRSVILSDDDSNATIVYTTDGDTVPYIYRNGDGTYTVGNGDIYTGPVTVNANTTIRALAFRNGYAVSETSAAAYRIKASAPIFTPSITDAVTGSGALSVSTDTEGASVYYTTDGSDPSGSGGNLLGTLEAVSIDKNMTVRAVTKASGLTDSDETSATYYVHTAVPQASISSGGTVQDGTTLYLSCESGAVIYYMSTADGSDPSDPAASGVTPSVYFTGIPLTGSSSGTVTYKIRAYAKKTGMKDSFTSEIITIYVNDGKVSSLSFSKDGGLWYQDISVSITCGTAGASIYYTLDGSVPDPSTAGSSSATKEYSSAVSIAGNGTMKTLKAIAVKDGMTDSDVKSATYTIITKTETPGLSPAAGTFTVDQNISISCDTSGAAIYYTTNGTTPQVSKNSDGSYSLVHGTLYSSGLSIASSGVTISDMTILTIKAIAVRNGIGCSDVASGTFYLISDVTGIALWSKPVSAGTSSSVFNGVATDSSGNSYAAGYLSGQGSYDFGNGITIAADTGRSTGTNMLIVKYNSAGECLWARTVTAADASMINGIAIDSSGNLYVTGYVTGQAAFGFGSGITIAADSARNTGTNIFVAKYNSGGACQWAESVTNASGASCANAIAVNSGNLVLGGYVSGAGEFTFGGKILSSNASRYSGNNMFLVQYSTDGTCSWVNSVASSGMDTSAAGVAIDTSGYIYMTVNTSASEVSMSVIFDSISLTFPYTNCGALLKYNSSGYCSRAVTITDSPNAAYSYYILHFNGIAVGASSVYATGYIHPGVYTFTTSSGGSVQIYPPGVQINSFVIKFDANLYGVWGTSEPSAPNDLRNCYGLGITIDGSGNVYQAGYLAGQNTFYFGTIAVQELIEGGYTPFMAKYNSSGSVVWAQSMDVATGNAVFNGISLNTSANTLCAVGYYSGVGAFDYGGRSSSFTGKGSSGANAVIVRYAP